MLTVVTVHVDPSLIVGSLKNVFLNRLWSPLCHVSQKCGWELWLTEKNGNWG